MIFLNFKKIIFLIKLITVEETNNKLTSKINIENTTNGKVKQCSLGIIFKILDVGQQTIIGQLTQPLKFFN